MLPMSALAMVARDTPLEHQLFARILALQRFHISFAIANSRS